MKVILIGYGKMGKAVEEAALERGHTIVAKLERHHVLSHEQVKAADVAIEFTNPESAFDNISMCLRHGLPVVSGSTGWLHRKAELDAYCTQRGGTYLQASNFSIGVHLFLKACQQAAALFNGHAEYKASITEVHHTEKKDMPSGTALLVQESIAQTYEAAASWHLTNHDATGTGLPITSHREVGVPGTHTLTFSSAIDDITITHQAHNRKGFAQGAVVAAEWIVGKKGVYTMTDVLGL